MKVDEIIKSVNRGDFVVSNDNPHVIIKQGRKSRKMIYFMYNFVTKTRLDTIIGIDKQMIEGFNPNDFHLIKSFDILKHDNVFYPIEGTTYTIETVYRAICLLDIQEEKYIHIKRLNDTIKPLRLLKDALSCLNPDDYGAVEIKKAIKIFIDRIKYLRGRIVWADKTIKDSKLNLTFKILES